MFRASCATASPALMAVAAPTGAVDSGKVALSKTVQSVVNGVTQAEPDHNVLEISVDAATVFGGATTGLVTRRPKDRLVVLAERHFLEHLASHGLSPSCPPYPGTGVVPPGRSVIAETGGSTKPKEIVVIAAHLDTAGAAAVAPRGRR